MKCSFLLQQEGRSDSDLQPSLFSAVGVGTCEGGGALQSHNDSHCVPCVSFHLRSDESG